MTTQTAVLCPRGPGMSALHGSCPGDDSWVNGTCSYCGSLNPETFMERLRAGTIEIVPSDNNTKVGVKNVGGEPFMHEVGERRVHPVSGEATIVSALKENLHAKFYYRHLSMKQREELLKIYNDKAMKLGHPGRFYVWPFFMRPA